MHPIWCRDWTSFWSCVERGRPEKEQIDSAGNSGGLKHSVATTALGKDEPAGENAKRNGRGVAQRRQLTSAYFCDIKCTFSLGKDIRGSDGNNDRVNPFVRNGSRRKVMRHFYHAEWKSWSFLEDIAPGPKKGSTRFASNLMFAGRLICCILGDFFPRRRKANWHTGPRKWSRRDSRNQSHFLRAPPTWNYAIDLRAV